MTGVRLTGPGADRGIDVTADVGVAQVKHQATPVGAPVAQGALGAGHGRQKVLFFALSGFTRQAADFAQQAGVALFSYDIYGSVTPRNVEANCIPDLANTGLPRKHAESGRIRPHTTQSDAQIVHTVHTPKVAFQRTPEMNRVLIRGNAVHLFVATSRTTSGCTSS
jgi:hypothetical protein